MHDGEWGTVCDDSFNLQVAHVYCRMLGYTRAVNYHHSARWGKGDGPIWLDEVKCDGTEFRVEDCTHNGWGNSDCEHHEDAGVLCHTERIPGFDIQKLREAQVFEKGYINFTSVAFFPEKNHKAFFWKKNKEYFY